MPTGLKVAIGCLAAFFVLAAMAAVAIGAGGMWLKGKADGMVEGVQARAEAQQEASAILERLEREYPFTPPSDGEIDPSSADRFFEATALAWGEIEPTVRNLDEISERNRDDRSRLGDMVEGMRSVGLLADSRLHIARSLDEAGLSLEEYVWTGQALRNAPRVDGANGVYTERWDAIDSSDGEPGPSVVLDLATAWSSGLSGAPVPTP
ncbi:MAG: hypothetical protein ACODAA_00255 [Gemmatimonadota bacterium]